MDSYPKSRLPVRDVKKFIIIFYIVGFLGFLIPWSRSVFILITPLALLLNTYLLAVYHKEYGLKEILLFLFIFFSGYLVEVMGVKTGWIFGYYVYGKALGVKLFETPLLIGVNWLFLVYVTTAITVDVKINKWLAIFTAPLLMLGYDLILEQVAQKIYMWTWMNSEVPIRNYVAWYVIAFCYVLMLKVYKVETKNPLAAILFICQSVFLALLAVLL